MNKKILPALLISLTAVTGQAASLENNYEAGLDLYSDSDEMTIDKWSIGTRKGHDIFNYKHDSEPAGELLWSLKATKNDIDQDVKDDYKGHTIFGTVGQKLNDTFSAEAGLGLSQQKNQRTGVDDDLTLYQLKAKATLNEQLSVQASHKRDYMFDHAIIASDDGKLVHGDNSNLSLFWRPQEKWRASGSFSNNDLSDGNASQQLGGSLLYGISPGWPWIWAGMKAQKLEYDQRRNSYWTPEEFTSYGLTVDSSFAVNDDLSMSLGADVSRNKEDSNPTGTGYSLSAGADWKVAENINLKAKGYMLESTQESSEWKQDGINLSVNLKSY